MTCVCAQNTRQKKNNNTTLVLKTSEKKILIKIRMIYYSSKSGNSRYIKQKQSNTRRANIFMICFEVILCVTCREKNIDKNLKHMIN